MARSVEALANPRVLVWARRTAGLGLEQAARKAQVTPERLDRWEHGESRPTIIQLRKLGNIYKRPIAVFYLADPPEGFQIPHDFRRLPEVPPLAESPELLLQIRRAQERRELALELLRLAEMEPPSLSLIASPSNNAEQLAWEIRSLLGIEYEDQVRWDAGYEAFNHWRAALENVGTLVFQAIDVEVAEMRGFSIPGEKLPAIVVNIKDSIRGRMFSMIHELTHLLLHQPGVCSLRPEDVPAPATDEQAIEVFCNRVAGAVLVPRRFLLSESVVARNEHDSDWTDEQIEDLADGYGVSREVLLRRLLITQQISNRLYDAKVEEYREEYAAASVQRATGFAPPHRIAISSAGPLFVRLVLDSYYGDRITASDVSDFLDVRLKHLSRIESEVFKGVS